MLLQPHSVVATGAITTMKFLPFPFVKNRSWGTESDYLFIDIPGKNDQRRISAVQIEIPGNSNKGRELAYLLFELFYVCFKFRALYGESFNFLRDVREIPFNHDLKARLFLSLLDFKILTADGKRILNCTYLDEITGRFTCSRKRCADLKALIPFGRSFNIVLDMEQVMAIELRNNRTQSDPWMQR